MRRGQDVPTRIQDPWPWSVATGTAAVLTYLRTTGFGWVYDDQMDVVRNPFVQDWGALPDLFTTTVWTGSGMETYLYRPLTQFSYLLNHTVSGLDPWSFHLVNVALHALVTVLVLRVGLRWGLAPAAAGFGALLFALHPAHVEVVAAVHGRKELWVAAFVLTLVLVHRRARERGGGWAAAAVILLTGALLSKETGTVAVPLILAADLLSPSRARLVRDPRVQGLYAAYAATTVLYLAIRTRITGTLGVPDISFFDNPLVGADPFTRLGTALVVVGRGLGSLVYPGTLSPDYSFDAIPLVEGILDARLLAALAILSAMGWAAVHFRRRRPWVTLAVIWYFVALLPASNLVVAVGTIFGDRLLYLPSVAFCLAVGGIAVAAWRRLGGGRAARAASLLVAGTWLAALGVRTVRYTSVWVDDVTLFEWAVEEVPRSTKAHHKLGEEYLRADRPAEALLQLDAALAIAPSNAFAAATRRQAAVRLVQDHPALFRDPLGAPLPPDPGVLRALARLMAERGREDAAQRLVDAADGG